LEKVCFIETIGNNYRVLIYLNELMAAKKTAVVVPNWNGKGSLKSCLDSLLDQSEPCDLIVVDNGSTDGSVEFLEKHYPQAKLIKHKRNTGFTGGVNSGMNDAIATGYEYVALFNNDAIADKDWLNHLVKSLDENPRVGIATSTICDSKRTHFDSTGDIYTIWGLPFPRGRGEPFSDKYDELTDIFGASGGASIYRVKMLERIGIFDQDFFAYYEDIDLSFRAQLAGWTVRYAPKAICYHEIGATSSKIKGFSTYQTLKNLPQVWLKDVPGKLFWKVLPRFTLAYWSFFVSALARGRIWPAFKGVIVAFLLTPKKLIQRYKIQSHRKVSVSYIDSILTHDLPPNAHKLRRLMRKPL
jgi:GT2 family glycosyltransferase